jgi:uncharacterized protein YneF (UPF0154 family)
MKDFLILILIAIGVVLKLILTGMCLAIGFKLGYLIIDKCSQKKNG